MQTTVPPLPAGHTGWRKTLTGITDANGGTCVQGEWLNPGDVTDIPIGTLVVTVDKVTIRWDYAYGTGRRIPVQEVTVTAHLAGVDGLTELWCRHFKTSASAFGATTRKKLATLLAVNPADAGEVTVIKEARRPNHREDKCPNCGAATDWDKIAKQYQSSYCAFS